jgi:hypothetical protein
MVLRNRNGIRVPPCAGHHVAVPEGVIMAPGGSDIPIYVGGSGVSAVSIRRTIQFGDGWMPYSPTGDYDTAALGRTLRQLRDAKTSIGQPVLETIYKLEARGHNDPMLDDNVAELARLGFDEIIVQGIWDSGLDPGIATIRRMRTILDAVAG